MAPARDPAPSKGVALSGDTRIGLLYPSGTPIAPGNWSGTPNGLYRGLSALGVQVVPLGPRVAPGVRHAIGAVAAANPIMGAVAARSEVARAARLRSIQHLLDASGPLAGIVAMGTETYDLERLSHPGVRIATYDDGTLRQMWRHPESDIRQARYRERTAARWAERQGRSARAADVCCVVTSWAGGSVVSDYGVPRSRVAVVGIGHDPRGEVANVVRDWSSPRFLFVGVDWKRKNGDAVVRAYVRVRDAVPEATLDVVGDHPRLDVPGVTGHGRLAKGDPEAQYRLDNLFARSTTFVVPSRFEPAGIVYLEAASAGMPVITTTEGGASELLGDAAMAVHPDDQVALEAAMLDLSVPATAQRLGSLAAARARGSRWSDVAGRILAAMQLAAPRATDGSPRPAVP